MDEKIDNIIPTIMGEMWNDWENESSELLAYYQGCNTVQRSVINFVMICLCGYSFETILEKCGIRVDEHGDPVTR